MIADPKDIHKLSCLNAVSKSILEKHVIMTLNVKHLDDNDGRHKVRKKQHVFASSFFPIDPQPAKISKCIK